MDRWAVGVAAKQAAVVKSQLGLIVRRRCDPWIAGAATLNVSSTSDRTGKTRDKTDAGQDNCRVTPE
jgi:hypothetical protein